MCDECCMYDKTKLKIAKESDEEETILERTYKYEEHIDFDITENFDGEPAISIWMQKPNESMGMDFTIDEIDLIITKLIETKQKLLKQIETTT